MARETPMKDPPSNADAPAESNGHVQLTPEQNAIVANLTQQREAIDAQLKLVLQTIAAGEGFSECGDMHIDTDAGTVAFLPVPEA